ncbi:hypothetical protein D3C71_2189720 [compost metagenome]
MLAGGALGRVAADFRAQRDEIDEVIGLAPQVVGDHWRLGRHRRHDRDLSTLALQRLDERGEIAIAREDH